MTADVQGEPLPRTGLRYGPGSAVLLLPGCPATLVNADTAQSFEAPAELVSLLCRSAGWTLDDVVADGLPLDAASLGRLVAAGIVEPVVPPAVESTLVDPVALAVLRSGSLDHSTGMGAAPGAATESRAAVTLPEPARLGRTLEDVLSARRSSRAFAGEPLTADELGTVLHHAARERSGSSPRSFPYAAGGARAELAVVVVVDRVEGVSPGPYRYDAVAHVLSPIAAHAPTPDHARSLAGATGGTDGTPAVMLMIVSSVGSLTTRYGRRGVTLAHANSGALLQTLYLTATALGLACCAVGGANQREDSAWLGLDPQAEFPLAYFLLGRAS